jgi:hypothetical protein
LLTEFAKKAGLGKKLDVAIISIVPEHEEGKKTLKS